MSLTKEQIQLIIELNIAYQNEIKELRQVIKQIYNCSKGKGKSLHKATQARILAEHELQKVLK